MRGHRRRSKCRLGTTLMGSAGGTGRVGGHRRARVTPPHLPALTFLLRVDPLQVGGHQTAVP